MSQGLSKPLVRFLVRVMRRAREGVVVEPFASHPAARECGEGYGLLRRVAPRIRMTHHEEALDELGPSLA
jgi:hypothetical protein